MRNDGGSAAYHQVPAKKKEVDLDLDGADRNLSLGVRPGGVYLSGGRDKPWVCHGPGRQFYGIFPYFRNRAVI